MVSTKPPLGFNQPVYDLISKGQVGEAAIVAEGAYRQVPVAGLSLREARPRADEFRRFVQARAEDSLVLSKFARTYLNPVAALRRLRASIVNPWSSRSNEANGQKEARGPPFILPRPSLRRPTPVLPGGSRICPRFSPAGEFRSKSCFGPPLWPCRRWSARPRPPR